MNHKLWSRALGSIAVALLAFLPACGGGGNGGGNGGFAAIAAAPVNTSAAPSATVQVTVSGPNAVTTWNEVAIDTINAPATPGGGSPAEQRPTDSVDLATVHLAVYNALALITGSYRTYGSVASSNASLGASAQAAVGAAAYGVLKGLYPNRSAQYQPVYDSFTAAISDDAGKTIGLALGADTARAILADRANDGRSVALAPYVPGTAPGQFRGVNPVNRYYPSIKPFSLTSAAQFRVPAPLPLDSSSYATDLNETRLLGGASGSARTDAQLELARFHTEPPFRFWPRNLRRFATTDGSLMDQARLLAMLFTVQADATIACFESKYAYNAWRPLSAIPLADTDGNAATDPDPAWVPVVPTPNHPEYPAAHACTAAAVAETLKSYYRTDKVAFTFDSTVTGTTHSFSTTESLVEEVRGARIYGGMHFRNSMLRGEELGTSVAQWVLQRNFQAR